MQRYFVKEKITTEYVTISEDFHHIKNVMRMSKGDTVIVSDQEKAYKAVITEFTSNTVLLKTVTELDSNELNVRLAIGIGLMQNKKIDFLVQKLTELGVTDIIPINMQRSIVKPKDNKIERWMKIAKEASEQSHRMIIPTIHPVISLKDLNDFEFKNKYFAYEASKEDGLINNIKDSSIFIVGPEGGIDEKEVILLKEMGYNEISLGKRILRAETAPLFIMSVVGYSIEMSE